MSSSNRFRFGVLLIACVAVAPASPVLAIEVAETLLVDLSAADASAGEPVWANNGTLGDFTEVGDTLLTTLAGIAGVLFDGTNAYTCADVAPAGIAGPSPTRSIEVWAYNETIDGEETLLSWGRRGPNDGNNMSFNYGSSPAFGAVGHWGAPDLGWGIVPAAGEWHHLVYTFDGATTRVYADGYLSNSEALAPGAIDTYIGTQIALAAQWINPSNMLEPALRGTLALARVRVHDGVLSDAQVLANFNEEALALGLSTPPTINGAPAEDSVLAGAGVYSQAVSVRGFPPPAVSVLEPAGATVTSTGPGAYTFTYDFADPPPASFVCGMSAESTAGDVEVFWTVTVINPVPGVLEVAGELFVDLDAGNATAGTAIWENAGSIGDFMEAGDPVLTTFATVPAVSFNGSTDYYVCLDSPAPAGLTGLDPTRTIEAWVANTSILPEETILSWGRRGGGVGQNMSFNYGTNGLFGAVGHWGDVGPDLGWNNAGGAPAAGQWHHLVYTYDGQTTRVYADGAEANSEFLGPGALNTHIDTAILLAAQWQNATTVEPGLRGSLFLGRVRIHDGALLPEQVLHNYETERDDFPTNTERPVFLNAPAADSIFTGAERYTATVAVRAFPAATVTVLLLDGATVTQTSPLSWTLDYPIPDPEPATFTVRLRASNEIGFTLATWNVTVVPPPAPGATLSAGQVFVDLDAADPSAGSETWVNDGTLSDFVRVGEPARATIDTAPAVVFNGGAPDAYQSVENAPPGLVGLDPTRSIEVWAYNEGIANEETLIAWGRRGGPNAGSNMSFNYGTNNFFGAVGHWGFDGPDLGWNNAGGAPVAFRWHHLVYTYDGITTRVYSDGALANSEDLGQGVIDTHADTKITLAAQLEPDGVLLNVPLAGTLALGRVRVHDGVLSPFQVLNNYLAEKDSFPPPAPPTPSMLTAAPIHRYSFNTDASDVIGGADGIAYGNVAFAGGQASFGNDGTQNSNASGQSPPAAPPGAYIDLPNGIVSELGNVATFEAWVTWGGPDGSLWQRIFDFGTSTTGEDYSDGGANQHYIFLTPWSGAGTLRCGYRDGPTAIERNLEGPVLPVGTESHIAVVWGAAGGQGGGAGPFGTTVSLYLNGLEVARDTAAHITLDAISDLNNWLGRSQWPDPMLTGGMNEFRIYDYALTPGEVLGNFQAGADTVNFEGGPPPPEFLRGDTTGEGTLNITDGVNIFNWLFLGGQTPGCLEAANPNDGAVINITSGVYLLNFLFLGGPAPPAPGPPTAGGNPCGPDPLGSPSNLGCITYNGC